MLLTCLLKRSILIGEYPMELCMQLSSTILYGLFSCLRLQYLAYQLTNGLRDIGLRACHSQRTIIYQENLKTRHVLEVIDFAQNPHQPHHLPFIFRFGFVLNFCFRVSLSIIALNFIVCHVIYFASVGLWPHRYEFWKKYDYVCWA